MLIDNNNIDLKIKVYFLIKRLLSEKDKKTVDYQ